MGNYHKRRMLEGWRCLEEAKPDDPYDKRKHPKEEKENARILFNGYLENRSYQGTLNIKLHLYNF